MNKTLDRSVLNTYSAVDEKAVEDILLSEINNDAHKLVVLDDDPTGVQTVHDISVYTDWTEDSIRAGFAEKNKVFYILTNSRGMTAEETKKIHEEIVEIVSKVSKDTGVPYIFMSRSDSTLRGHYPLEPEILRQGMAQSGIQVDGEILCFFFKEGGRFTINNVHYVQQGDQLVPAAETEFAKDKTFGYTKSAIPEYIEEKTKGAYKADSVTCISLDSLRNCDYDTIEQQLLKVRDFGKVCVNAIDYCDLKVFAVALYRAMAKGKNFIFRTAASLVKVMGGVSDIPLLEKKDLIKKEITTGGVVVVGSYTQKTTAQLNELLKLPVVVPVEFNSNTVLDGDDAFYAEINRCVQEEEKIISTGKVAVCFTCRKLLTLENDTPESALIRSVKISDGVQKLVGSLKIKPAFVIAKGGITSSDVGIKALCVHRADVMGQIRPGIPVWKTGNESRFPGTPYVIFPGNTGNENTLREVVEILTSK